MTVITIIINICIHYVKPTEYINETAYLQMYNVQYVHNE